MDKMSIVQYGQLGVTFPPANNITSLLELEQPDKNEGDSLSPMAACTHSFGNAGWVTTYFKTVNHLTLPTLNPLSLHNSSHKNQIICSGPNTPN